MQQRARLETYLKTGGLLLLSCTTVFAASDPEISAHTGTKPFWAEERPSSDSHFIGIGLAPIGNNLAESKDLALKQALSDISTQIEVTVLSHTYQENKEDGTTVGRAYRSDIRALVSANLEGVEIVDTWQDNTTYWVYARLSRLEFERLRKEKIESARRRASMLFVEAEKERSRSVAQSISFYLHALRAVQDALGDPIVITHQGQALHLDTELPIRTQQLLSSVSVEAERVTKTLKRGMDLAVPLRFQVSFKGGEMHPNMGNIPIRFFFDNGEGELTNTALTSDDGVVVATLSKVLGRSSVQTIKATIDLPYLIRDGADSSFCQQLSRFALPEATFQFNVVKRVVCLASAEFNLGGKLTIARLEPLLKRGLEEEGISFTDQAGQADLSMELEAQTRPGQRFQNIYYSYLDLGVSVKDQVSGTEIWKTSLSSIKGAGANYEQAGIKAYEKAGELIKTKILPELRRGL